MIPCPTCHRHVRTAAVRCPHCDGAIGARLGPSAAALVLGLFSTLPGCIAGKNVDYGTTVTGDTSIEDSADTGG
ncbi:MAG: hypothetical protein ABMA64_11855 [Myxococcota bacterium]